jgi:subtilase family serine protease
MSVGQGGYEAGPAATPIVAPALPVAPLFQGTTPTGYSPSQIRSAYGLNQISFGSVSGTGAGQTIAIIDAYFDPNIRSDLATFDAQYGLSAPPAFAQYIEGGMFYDNSEWALETALDVEWAHAIAPAANIVLVETQPDLSDLLNAATCRACRSSR